MTRRRWIADEVSGDRAALVGDQAAHLAQVLRAQIGQQFDISISGRVRRGRIAIVSPERVEFDLGEEVESSAVPEIHLLLAIFKFDRMEWAIEKATELGVARICPIVTQRSERHLAVAAEKRRQRWQRIARQAAQQSRRVTAPEICAPAKLKDAVMSAAPSRIVLDESEHNIALKHALESASPPVALAVGPEGGWTEAELRSFKDLGWLAASFGPTILRAETAVVAALAVVMAEL